MAWSSLGPHNIPFYGGFGVETPFGIFLPPGSKVAAYVRSGGVSTQDSPEIQSHLVQTLASALSYVRSGRGDTIIVLPGHAEDITDATMLTNLVADTRILGASVSGLISPRFRWTTTSAQWAINKSGVVIQNLRLRLEGANGVVKAIAVTASDVVFAGCDIEVASGAANKATIAIEFGAGSGRGRVLGCRLRGTATHNVTDGILIASAETNIEIIGNRMAASATAGNGLIRVTAAATDLHIARNTIYNTHTSSTACIAFANVAADGVVEYNNLYTNSTGVSTSGTEGIAFAGANVLVKCAQNFVSNDKQTSGELLPTADT